MPDEMNEGWVGGEAAGSPLCRRVVENRGFSKRRPVLAGRAVRFPGPAASFRASVLPVSAF
jgi:hypothetical protein